MKDGIATTTSAVNESSSDCPEDYKRQTPVNVVKLTNKY